MGKQSAGLLLHRMRDGGAEVFLVHPGGPFWAKKDRAAWSIPKGEFFVGEDPLPAAQRELKEETGFTVSGPFTSLAVIKQAGGKLVHAFAAAAPELEPARIVSNTFELEWPPRSGQRQRFPEIDRAGWFSLEEAATKLHAGQVPLLAQLRETLSISGQEHSGCTSTNS